MVEWYHSFPELGFKGYLPHSHEEFVTQLIPEDLTGKTVLDLAAFDGYYSYLACKRGAETVVAVDNGIHEELGYDPHQANLKNPDRSYPNPEEHELAIKRLYEKYNILNNEPDVNIHFIPLDVNDLDKIDMTFDYVFCFGLYYHVKNPYDLFEKCYNRCNEKLLVEGEIKAGNRPVMYINSKLELNEDSTNYWSPTPQLIKKLLMRIGFRESKIIAVKRVRSGGRALFSCSK